MSVEIPAVILENFKFLLTEVSSQVSSLRAAFERGSANAASKILDRSGYPDNLKMRIRDDCITAIKKQRKGGAISQSIKSIETVAIDLDRTARLCRHCARQLTSNELTVKHIKRRHVRMLKHVESGLVIVGEAAESTDIKKLLKLAALNEKIGREYGEVLKQCHADLKKYDETEPIVASIFIAQRIEDMGNALQDMGDTLISAKMGQQLSADSYRSLTASVDTLKTKVGKSDLTMESLAQTRSGSQISGILEAGADSDSYIAVFKDGKRRKLKEERDKVNVWNELFPGLAPMVLGYHKNDQSAALLLEHLQGQTLEEIILSEPVETLNASLNKLMKTLSVIWTKTHRKTPVPAGYMAQLTNRIGAIYELHPDFNGGGSSIGGHAVKPFETLIAECEAFEKNLDTPYTVRIHGDFNLDNILYDNAANSIRFIDLHRSQNMDFVQDVSVFMVSLYRLQAMKVVHRRRVHYAASKFYDFAQKFAAKADDPTFEIRLALGLARSFATSTRFILDRTLAGNMFIRSRFLLEQVQACPKQKTKQFSTPVKELFIG